jgi:hypothetical protein
MKFALAALSVFALLGAIGTQRPSRRRASAEERTFTWRFTAFVWLVVFLMLVAFVFLPNKGRVLMMLPAFLLSVSLAKWWKSSRARLRKAAERQTNFERARRVN